MPGAGPGGGPVRRAARACEDRFSQALIPYFLPRQISIYRAAFPGVTFAAKVRDRFQAELDLATFESDLALVFEAAHVVDFEVLHAVRQPVMAVMSRAHPLAGRQELRLRECMEYDLVLPAPQFRVRGLRDAAAKRVGRTLEPAIETDSFDMIRHFAAHGQSIGFQIPVGLKEPARRELAYRILSERDVAGGELHLWHLKGRTLPVAALKFVRLLALALDESFGTW